MESIGDVLQSAMPSKGQVLNRIDQQLNQLLEDPLVIELRKEHPQLDVETIKLNMSKVYQYVTEYRSSMQCKNVDECTNSYPGHYTKLEIVEVGGKLQIYERKVPTQLYLAKQHELQVRSRIRSFYMDDQMLKQGYSTEEILTKDPARSKAVGQVLRYIDQTRREGLKPSGLYLQGLFGTGKTFLMCYMLQELAKAGHNGIIVYMPDFAEDLKSMMHEQGRLKETIDMMKETDLLIFDDIGAENLNPWLRDHVLGAILNYRMQRKPTFYTSNHELSALERHFSFTHKDGEELHKGQRLMDRIRPYVEVVRVVGTNKRGMSLG